MNLLDAVQSAFSLRLNASPPRSLRSEPVFDEGVDALISEYGYWGEHPAYPVADWAYEAGNNDTRLSYWEWAQSRETTE